MTRFPASHGSQPIATAGRLRSGAGPLIVVGTILWALLLGLSVVVVGPVPAGLLLAPMLLLVMLALPRAENMPGRLLFGLTLFWLLATVIWPRYVAVRLPGVPDLLPGRIAYGLLLVVFAYAWINTTEAKRRISAVWKTYPVMTGSLAVVVLARLTSVAFSQFPGSALYGFLNEFITYYPAFLIGVLATDTRERMVIFSRVLFLSALFVGALGVLEARLAHNLFVGILPAGFSFSTEFVENAIAEKIRGGHYRVQSTFSHPLLYAQFLLMAAPYLLVEFSGRLRSLLFWGGASTLLMTGALYKTGSRAGMVALAAEVTIGAVLVIAHQMRRRRPHPAAWICALALPVLLGIVAVGAIQYSDALMGRNVQEIQSSNVRMEMVRQGIEHTIESPLVGYGVGHAVEVLGFVGHGGSRTLDSYFVTLMVDSGFLCIAGFILFAGLAWANAVRLGIGATARLDRDFCIATACSITGYGLTAAILSTPHNIPIFYCLVGVLAGLGAHAFARRDERG